MAFQKIGLVGLGRMGANMARRLKDCGYQISAMFDQNIETTTLLAEELNTQVAPNLASLTEISEVVITVVSDDAAMSQIYENPADNLLMNATGKYFINCATISPDLLPGMRAKQN